MVMILTVGIDASVIASGAGGTRVYALQLLKHLIDRRKEWTFVLYLRGRVDDEQFDSLTGALNVQTRTVNAGPNAWRVQVALPSRLQADGIDLYHSLGFFLPVRWKGPKVVTIHDLNMFANVRNWWRGPTMVSWLDLSLQTPISIRVADHIVTDSESSRNQILRMMRVPAERITVIPLAADPFFGETPSLSELAEATALVSGQPFVLCVGILSPQKNLLTLVQAFAKSNLPAVGVRLLIAGSDRENYGSTIRRQAKSLGVEAAVDLPGFISTAMLRALYRRALCLVLPSHGEGFGLPLVEAMASGTPILAANRQAIPEVLGEAGRLFEPRDVDTLSGLLNSVATNARFRDDLARRSRLGHARFSWEKTADATAEVYEHVMARRRL
jgi:glycosyltransferase involved in cell wall biosynthesis